MIEDTNRSKEDIAFLVDVSEAIQYVDFEKYIFATVTTGLAIMAGDVFVHPLLSKIMENRFSLKKKHRDTIDLFLNAGPEGNALLLQILKPLIDCYEIEVGRAREYYRNPCGKDNTIGGRLYTERKASKIDIPRAAELCEVTTKQYKQWENNEVEPPLSALRTLHKLYGFDLNYVIGEDCAIISTCTSR